MTRDEACAFLGAFLGGLAVGAVVEVTHHDDGWSIAVSDVGAYDGEPPEAEYDGFTFERVVALLRREVDAGHLGGP